MRYGGGGENGLRMSLSTRHHHARRVRGVGLRGRARRTLQQLVHALAPPIAIRAAATFSRRRAAVAREGGGRDV
jgi:hypothetical protein|eukprot:SAG25_NODE_119_length_14756_cov_696.499898_3_plen_74_part_00